MLDEMRLGVPILATALVACAGTPRPEPAHAKRADDTPRFSQRPLKIEVEGTSEKRKALDLTFIGLEVMPLGSSDLRVIATAMARYVRIPVVAVPSQTVANACPTLDHTCMPEVAATLNAKHLLWGTLAIEGGAIAVSLHLLDVAAKRIDRTWTEKLTMDRLRHDDVQALMERGRLAVLGTEESTLLVESDVDGTLYVDGTSHGKLAVPRTSVRVKAGKHRIKIESRGFASTERELDVPASHFVRVVVTK